jgi:hypothetical protein
MSLTEDQRAAAAQLVKDEAVEIECDKVGHNGDVLEGSGCTLALVDVMPKQVNLALFVANDNGTTGVYVVGPMTEADCFAQGDSVPPKMHVNQQGEYVVWRGCTNAARETIAPEGCHLNTSPMTVPGMSSAQLWRYDCGSSGSVHTSTRKRSGAHPSAATDANAGTAAQASTGRDESQDPTAAKAFALTLPEATPTQVAAVPPTAVQPMPAQAGSAQPGTAQPGTGTTSQPTATQAAATLAAGAALAGTASNLSGGASPSGVVHTQTGDIRLASASDSDVGTSGGSHAPAEEATVAHAPPPNQQTASPHSDPQGSAVPPNPTSDDLTPVRTVDPQAAEHIATYCDKAIPSANRDTLVTECRQREAEAWTRLVLKNEFPTLDDATRRKCSEPPFPDTYVAKESCARYELHLN